jgi:hypothetical protein
MSSIKGGIFAGLKAGFLYFVIASIINVIVIYIFTGEFAIAYGVSPSSSKLSLLFTLLTIYQIRDIFILGLLFGVVFSLLLAKYFEVIPRNTLNGKIKFMVISYWLVFFVITTAYSLGITGIYDLVFYFISYVVVNFFLSLLFGRFLYRYNSRYIVQTQ